MAGTERVAGNIECRGRNGWFFARKVEVGLLFGHEEIYVHIYSRRSGEFAPIIIIGPADDMVRLADEIKHLVRVAKANLQNETFKSR